MSIDKGFGTDLMGISAGAPMAEGGRERTMLVVHKWDGDQTDWAHKRLNVPEHITIPGRIFRELRVNPYEDYEYHGNLITRAGWGALFTGFFGTQATLFSTTTGRIGVGTSVTAATSADAALGSIASMTGNNWILCGANPTLNSGVTPSTVVFVATFGATDGVGAWNEFAIDHGTANTASVTPVGIMINHSANIGAGTKAGGTWTATATLSFT